MVSELDADATVWTVRSGSLQSPNPGTTVTNYTFDAAGNVTGILGGRITLDVGNLGAVSQELGVAVTSTAVLGHEFGHGLGNIVLFREFDVRQPRPCRESCANVFEAIVRRQAGLPPRP